MLVSTVFPRGLQAAIKTEIGGAWHRLVRELVLGGAVVLIVISLGRSVILIYIGILICVSRSVILICVGVAQMGRLDMLVGCIDGSPICAPDAVHEEDVACLFLQDRVRLFRAIYPIRQK